MPFPFQYSKRLLTPIWRKFSDAVRLHELESSGTRVNKSYNFDETIFDWKLEKNTITASEVINSAIIGRNFDFPELKEAIILINQENATNKSNLIINSLQKSINHTNDHSNKQGSNEFFDLLLEDISVENINEVWNRIKISTIDKSIHTTRKVIQNDLSNPVNWVEISRLYLLKGQIKKSEQAMRIALSIAPDNKYVLRSSTCLFINLDDSEQALFFLRKSNRTKRDPWLISAHIAASHDINRFSPLIKTGKALIADANIPAYNLTELASSIGTDEYNSGGLKKARAYFNIALKRPNDNTLAQIEWISQQDNQFQFNPSIYLKANSYPFEAQALDALENEQWEDSILSGIKWFLAAPYNKQAAIFCIFILIMLFDKNEEALEFCTASLNIYPNDDALINNLLYLQIMTGKLDNIQETMKAFVAKEFSTLADDHKIPYAATMGLINFRAGRYDEGVRLYNLVIQHAIKIKAEEVGNIAYINLTKEVFKADLPDRNDYLTQLKNIAKKSQSKLVKYASNKTISQLEEQSKNLHIKF